jgi:hypothetical protein
LSADNDLRFDIVDPAISGVYQPVFPGAVKDLSNAKSFEMKAWEYLVYQK